jgi:hypothetical protein
MWPAPSGSLSPDELADGGEPEPTTPRELCEKMAAVHAALLGCIREVTSLLEPLAPQNSSVEAMLQKLQYIAIAASMHAERFQQLCESYRTVTP